METFLATRDFAVSGEEFRLIHDPEFDMLITVPRPEDMSRYYYSDSYISHTDSFKGLTEKLYHVVKRYMLRKKIRLLEKYTGGPGKILDIGAGTGEFLRIANRRNWQIAGVEPNHIARGLAVQKEVPVYENIAAVKGSDYDVITLWHTLEHIPDLDDLIDQMKRRLDEEGIVIVAVPNYKSLDARIYREYWAAYDVPRHLWHFSQKSIRDIFDKHGMQLVKKIPLRFDAYYIALLSEQYKNGRKNYLRAFLNGLRSNLSAISSKEYSSLLYILKRS